jgi:hypothetical protein
MDDGDSQWMDLAAVEAETAIVHRPRVLQPAEV